MSTFVFRSMQLVVASLLLLSETPNAWCFQTTGETSSTLYVLSSPEILSSPDVVPYSELLFIDPITGNIRRTLRIGFSADMAVSPDGTKVYVSSSYVSSPNSPDRQCFLEVYNTATGALIAKVPNPDGQQFTSSVHETAMAISPSGNWLYITKVRTIRDFSNFYIAAFDTLTKTFLPAQVSLFGCKAPTLLPSEKDLELSSVCSDSTHIREIRFRRSATALSSSFPFPEGFGQSELAAVIFQPEVGTLMFISRPGHVVSVDESTGQSTELASTSLQSEKDLDFERALVAKVRREAYFGSAVGNHDPPEQFDQIISVNASSGSVIRTVSVQPFFDMALSKDEKTIYLLHPSLSTLTAIDASTMKEARSIPLIGKTPYYAVAR